jgi:hypothetical protein
MQYFFPARGGTAGRSATVLSPQPSPYQEQPSAERIQARLAPRHRSRLRSTKLNGGISCVIQTFAPTRRSVAATASLTATPPNPRSAVMRLRHRFNLPRRSHDGVFAASVMGTLMRAKFPGQDGPLH